MYQTILGIFGVILTFLTGCFLNLFFVSYDFLEPNLLKRRFRFNLILQLFARSSIVYLYYLNITNVYFIKHAISHILGITAAYDFLKYLPFKNKTINICYGSITLIFEYTMIIMSLWELTP